MEGPAPANLFETHFHLSEDDDREAVFAPARARGVAYFLAVGGNLNDSIVAARVAEKHPDVWFAAGTHPHDAGGLDDDLSPFRGLARSPKFLAIGEIGLDYYYERSDRSTQRKVLDRFLALALELGRPAILHCRDKDGGAAAYAETFDAVKNFAAAGGRFEVHCFTGTTAWLERFLTLGAYIGVTGIVTFPRAENIREIVRVLPLDRLLLETDAPWLAPLPYRGKPNQPAYLPEVAAKIAEVRGLDIAAIADIATANAFAFFRIPKSAKIS